MACPSEVPPAACKRSIAAIAWSWSAGRRVDRQRALVEGDHADVDGVGLCLDETGRRIDAATVSSRAATSAWNRCRKSGSPVGEQSLPRLGVLDEDEPELANSVSTESFPCRTAPNRIDAD